jgi:outer membrane receptor for ferrienterochelin and colicin
MGFINDTVTIEILVGQTVSHNFVLIEEGRVMQTFSVVRSRNKGSEVSIVNDIKESKQIVNAIGSETIEKTQDSDASEVVKRVPGVTIVGNNFIMIRGLSERYNNVLLHDVFAPSMETDVKSFAFDIIPAGMIDRILVYKSPAPDITGEFAGGIVKIYTKGIPDSNYNSISFSTTFRDGSSFEDFYQPRRSKWHWTGFNDGYNNLPLVFQLM